MFYKLERVSRRWIAFWEVADLRSNYNPSQDSKGKD